MSKNEPLLPFFDAVNKILETNLMSDISLVPRSVPDSISQPWTKIGRRLGINTTSRTGNGGLGFVMMTLTAPSSLIATCTYGLHRYQVTNKRCVDISGRRFACTRDQKSSRRRASTSKQVSVPRPLSSKFGAVSKRLGKLLLFARLLNWLHIVWARCHHYETKSTLRTNRVHHFQSVT